MTVLDASVLIKCLLPEDGSAEARIMVSAGGLIAPELILSECVNALWKSVRLDRITIEEATEAEMILPSLGVELVRTAPLTRRALELALAMDHPAYDCFYVALAEQRGVEMITADGAFARKAEAAKVTRTPIRHFNGRS